MHNGNCHLLLVTDTLCDANGVSRFIQDIGHQAKLQSKSFKCISSTRKCHKETPHNMYILKPFFTLKMPFYPDLDLVIPPLIKLYKTIKKINPRVMHISTPGIFGLCALLIARRLKIPVAGTYHTDFPAYLYANTKLKAVFNITTHFERWFYKHFEAIFIRSEIYRETVTQRLNKQASQIHTIPAGIDIKRFTPCYRDLSIWDTFDIPQHAPKALYVGRMTEEKNIAFLLECWIDTFKTTQDGWLIMIGSGYYYERKEDYEAYHIRFIGHQEGQKLATLYASCDFFLFPSTTDTLGQVVIEALASGLAVVVSDIGGPQTLVNQHMQNGHVLEANNKHVWKTTIKHLVTDSRARQSLSKSASESVLSADISKSFTFFWQIHQKLGVR